MSETKFRSPPRPRAGEKGSAMRALLVLLGVSVLVLGILGACGVGKYNGIVSQRQAVDASWSQVENQYKRRYDLVPQLVETVRGAADFERSTLDSVLEARSKVGQVALTGAPTDPAQLQAWLEAQQGLGGALSRLIAVVESYPDLKASANFLSLQDQLEGNENRIAVARKDYVEAVRAYNTRIVRFPDNLIAGMFGFEKLPQFQIDEKESAVPVIDFDFGKK